MKKFLLLFAFFVAGIILTGCENVEEDNIDEIGEALLNQIPNQIEESFTLDTTYQDYDFTVTTSTSAPEVLSASGVVLDRSEEVVVEYSITVTYKGETKTFHKNVTVLMSEEAISARLNQFSNQVRAATPISTTENVVFMTSIEGHDVEIVYQSEAPDVISNNGAVSRQTINRNVRINYTIYYKGMERDFSMFVLVNKIPEETQMANIQDWLEAELSPLFAAESGTLPVVEGVYGYKINWLTDYPGIIDLDGGLTPAYQGREITLIGEARINLVDAKFTFTYTSNGFEEEVDKVEYIDSFFTNLMPLSIYSRTNLIYEGELDVIQSIVAPNTVTRLRPSDPSNPSEGRKMPGGPQYVVIHDTGNTSPGADAEMHNRYIHNQANSPTGRVASWHYTIDDKEVYQHVPDDEIAWHAGDGSTSFGSTWSGGIGGGNQNGIGIETCVNPENDYELTLRRTAKLTAELLYKYDLGIDRVKQHYDFSGKTCPARIRGQGIWYDFLKMVERELLLLIVNEHQDELSLEWTIHTPELIGPGGEVLYRPINDEDARLSLQLTFGEFSKTYEYEMTVLGLTLDQKLQQVHFMLYADTAKTATSDIELVTQMEDYGAMISWESSHPEIMSATGVYQKPAERTRVTLTVTIEIDGKTITDEFFVMVS